MWETLAHAEPRKETFRYATQYIAAAGGCADRRNLDPRFSETAELYSCHLFDYIWHSRIASMIGSRSYYRLEIGISTAGAYWAGERHHAAGPGANESMMSSKMF